MVVMPAVRWLVVNNPSRATKKKSKYSWVKIMTNSLKPDADLNEETILLMASHLKSKKKNNP